MPVLYITEPGAVLRSEGGTFKVTLDGDPSGQAHGHGVRHELVEVEPHRLEAVVLVGHCQATTDAVHLLLSQGIQLAWLERDGGPLGRLVPSTSKSADLRLLQYAQAFDREKRLARARQVVAVKIHNARAVLRGIQSNTPGVPVIELALARLLSLAESSGRADDAAALLGIEGESARTYFAAFGFGFKSGLVFSKRMRRPPPDPVNALLSLGYVLLGQRVEGALEARGLDPSLGFFHEVRPGRPSLALDLVEEFRHPVVDRFVLRSCNLKIFSPEDFEPGKQGEGVRLKPESLKKFFVRWTEALEQPMREEGTDGQLDPLSLLRRQADRLALDLRGGEAYAPFRAAL